MNTMQRDEALHRANQVRTERARIRAGLKAGTTDICDLLADPPEVLTRVEIMELLTWLPQFGTTRARRALHGVVGPSIALGRMGEATRLRLADKLSTSSALARRAAA